MHFAEESRPTNGIEIPRIGNDLGKYSDKLVELQAHPNAGESAASNFSLSALPYIEYCTQALHNHFQNVSTNITPELEDSSWFNTLLKEIPDGARVPFALFAIIVFAIMACMQSFIYTVAALGGTAIAYVALNSFTTRKAEQLKMEVKKEKMDAVANAQQFANQMTDSVARQAEDMYSSSLETMILQRKIIAQAQLTGMKQIEKLHAEEVSQLVDINKKSELGLNLRLKQRHDTALNNVTRNAQSTMNVAHLQADTQTQIKNAEHTMASVMMTNNVEISRIKNSTLLQVTKLQRDSETERVKRQAELETRKILEEKERQIRAEKALTEEHRRRSGL